MGTSAAGIPASISPPAEWGSATSPSPFDGRGRVHPPRVRLHGDGTPRPPPIRGHHAVLGSLDTAPPCTRKEAGSGCWAHSPHWQARCLPLHIGHGTLSTALLRDPSFKLWQSELLQSQLQVGKGRALGEEGEKVPGEDLQRVVSQCGLVASCVHWGAVSREGR